MRYAAVPGRTGAPVRGLCALDSSVLNRLLTRAFNAPNISPAGMTC